MPWILILIILAGYILFSCIRIVPQGYEYVIERLGRFKTIWPAGLHLKMPVIERIANKVNIKEMLLDGDLIPLPTWQPFPSKDGLVFTYQQYEIAPYAAGMPAFTIPYEDIAPYVLVEVRPILGL